jgi:glutathione synthase/RimK-type ligase-like ATP-grasp enzyme
MSTIVVVTYTEHPAILPDDQLAADILRAHGVTVEHGVWNAPETDWSRFDAVVVRSPWDYYKYPLEFGLWLDTLNVQQARVWNPTKLMLWNANKVYLQDLQDNGIAIVPTRWVEQDTKHTLAATLEGVSFDVPAESYVIKPTISAGAYQTLRVRPQALHTNGVSDEATFAEIVSHSQVMIQPYMPEIAATGEYSFLFFHDGERSALSHIILKTPATGDFRSQEQFGSTLRSVALEELPHTLLEQAHQVVDAAVRVVGTEWLYARVDGVVRDGQLLLMELEMIEPSLFLRFDADAPKRFANALLARL